MYGTNRKRRTPVWYWIALVLLLALIVGLGALIYSMLNPGGWNALIGGTIAAGEVAPLPQTEDAGEEYIDDTVFIGDSNTVRLHHTGVLTEGQCFGLEGMAVEAVPGQTFVRVEGDERLYTIPQAIAKVQPRRVVMTFGTNNIGSGLRVEDFIASYREAIAAIEEAWPHGDIIVNAIPPVARYSSYGNVTPQKVQEYNEALLAMCREDGLAFLNSAEALAGEDGYARDGYTIEDGLHLSEKGLRILVDYVRTHALK